MIPRAQWRLIVPVLMMLVLAVSARADITDIGPFVGEKSEDLENVSPLPGQIRERVHIFDGDVTLISLTGQTTIHLWRGSCLQSPRGRSCAFPRSGQFLIGATTKYKIRFHTPARKFGAYFTNISLWDDFNLRFFDADGNFLEERAIPLRWQNDNWHWRGWESDIPIGRIELRSNGVLEGFIWMDDLELTPADSCDACDMNCDGEIDALDIEPFLGLLFEGDEPCNACTGDVNGDGLIDALDIEPFLACLFP